MSGKLPFAQVIGDPIKQSKSPVIHGFWLEKLGLAAEYGKAHVQTQDLADYLTTSRTAQNWRGCNVTMPHKQAILPHLDSLDLLAERIGAVNTVVKQDDGSLRGFNTDVAGFLEPLSEVLAEKHLFRMARVLGTGGAARAIVAGLSDHGMVLVLAGRNPDKARSLINELAKQGDHHVATLDHFAEPTDFEFDDREGCFDIVVNASPLGMRGQPPLAFDFSHAPPGSIVYDIVMDPLETDFLRNAKDAGFRTIDGYSMLIGQAATAFELFFGQAPPREHDDELRERLTA
ncbi:shikimate dehydrogenase [Pontixanthobacter aestiaquae]|uniref:Shikimate dehydrogenase (NADP(+)) n=1 Tax=Pontixanthobacter aestiaquae TaxID=1509367 RepID=A0A844Z463_9SPHN|nr:shikimate dehydrogenase [Pontixanthobacter aestiaquae]MDN3646886.1 shikimate dehydrogenase [Pontixanthobacter aestiaquae]MXO82132.1 shikimate dehydrogenase [Pontixanthobacter aestiaquae]